MAGSANGSQSSMNKRRLRSAIGAGCRGTGIRADTSALSSRGACCLCTRVCGRLHGADPKGREDAQIYSSSATDSKNRQKKEWGALFSFFFSFWSLGRVFRVLSRGVRGAARDTRVRVSDEGDSVDDLLPRALNPRVFAGLGHSVRVLCSQECVASECFRCYDAEEN